MKLLALFLKCFLPFVLAVCKVVEFSQSNDSPGLVFEKKGIVKISDEQWSIITSINLQPFRSFRFNIEAYIGKLNTIVNDSGMVQESPAQILQVKYDDLRALTEVEKQVEILLETYLEQNLSKFTVNWLNYTSAREENSY